MWHRVRQHQPLPTVRLPNGEVGGVKTQLQLHEVLIFWLILGIPAALKVTLKAIQGCRKAVHKNG